MLLGQILVSSSNREIHLKTSNIYRMFVLCPILKLIFLLGTNAWTENEITECYLDSIFYASR